MKIKSRQAKLMEYNAKYTKIIENPEERIKQYFKERGWKLEKAIDKAKEKLNLILAEREYETIHLTLYEYPMKTDRPRSFRNHMYSPNASNNKSYLSKAWRQVIKTVSLINTPAEIKVEAYLEMPSNVPPDEVILFEAKVLNVLDKPDYDNIGKCYTDMLQDVIISDDDIFYRGEVVKYYSLLPRVEVFITYLTKHESDYIYKKLKTRKGIKEGIKSGQIILKKLG